MARSTTAERIAALESRMLRLETNEDKRALQHADASKPLAITRALAHNEHVRKMQAARAAAMASGKTVVVS